MSESQKSKPKWQLNIQNIFKELLSQDKETSLNQRSRMIQKHCNTVGFLTYEKELR